MKNSPSISVIIPMYNAEKYIGDCLESILAQTFQDFEVIVVDDCSTDSSLAIVESYAPKFNGRLMLLQLDRNTGSGAVPRNTGLKFAHGEYVFFMDADDLFTLTALEKLYTLAKDFDAEVVYCGKNYEATPDLGKIYISGDKFASFGDVPTLENEDFVVRVHNVLNWRYKLTTWSRLVRRVLLIEHEIFFPPVKIAEDDVLTYLLVFFAKRFLHVPNIVYIRRQAEKSVLRKKKSPQEEINFWLSPIIDGIKMLENMLSKLEFFRQNPKYLYAVMEHFAHNQLRSLFEASLKLPTNEIYTVIKNAFGENFGKHDVLISWLLADLIMQQKFFYANQQMLGEKKSEET